MADLESSEESNERNNVFSSEDKIEVDGRIYTVKEMMETKQQLENLNNEVNSLRSFKESTNMLMSDNLGIDQKMQAARVILSESGYSPQQIEAYVTDYQQVMNQEEQGSDEVSFDDEEYTDDNDEEMDNEYMDDPRIDEARQMAEASSNELKSYRLQMLQKEMHRGVGNAVDKNKEILLLLNRLPEEEGGKNNARSRIQQQVHDQTLKYLQERRAAEGSFNEAWVDEAAERAANEVVGTYRTVIGDLDSIGRSPETVSGEPTLSSTPPVPTPEYKEGMNRGVVDKSVNDWTTDTLSRLAEDSSVGEESKA